MVQLGSKKKLAMEAVRKIKAKLALGDLGVMEDKRTVPTFKDYADSWLHGHVKGLRRQSNFEWYQDVLRRNV